MTESEIPAMAVRVPRTRLCVALDVLAAGCLGTLVVLAALVPAGQPAEQGPAWLRIVLALVSASVIVTRRFAPLTSLAVAVTSSIYGYLLGFERDSFLTVAIVLYLIASTRSPRRSGRALAATVVVTPAVYMIAGPGVYGGPASAPWHWWQGTGMSATAIAIESAGWALGLAVYRQRSYLDAVRARAAREIGAERDRAARSAAEERLRIARDLHDIVAHAMSVITVQAGVARYIRSDGPDRTGEALEVIESTGRQALRDMRQLLGMLRDEGEGTLQAPTPRLADLPDLLDGARAAGTRVELSVRGDPRELPEGVELSAYRIVQEALTNVVKHAATEQAKVVLDYAPRELAIIVVDDGLGARAALLAGAAVGTGGAPAGTGAGARAAGGSRGGHGLIGMRERAVLHGGTLDAGPLPERGFRVTARLPIPAALGAVDGAVGDEVGRAVDGAESPGGAFGSADEVASPGSAFDADRAMALGAARLAAVHPD